MPVTQTPGDLTVAGGLVYGRFLAPCTGLSARTISGIGRRHGKLLGSAESSEQKRAIRAIRTQVLGNIGRLSDETEDWTLPFDPEALDAELRAELTEVRLQTEHGKIMMPIVPLDMGIIASDVFGLDDEDEAFARAKAELGMRPLVTLEWHEDEAPMFDNSLQVLHLGERAYISISPDAAIAQHWEAIAMCEPGSPEMLETFFLDLARDNGSTYSVDLYSALPTRVTSDYLSCDAIAASFAAYLDWDEARSPGAWSYACEYLPRAVEKTPDLVIGSMALRKEDNEFARRRYINAYATAVYDHTANAAAS